MNTRSKWIVRRSSTAGDLPSTSDWVMAWASDAATGAPIHVDELDESRNGLACRCVCAACGLQLQAVNAGKKIYKKRRHFRHPAGVTSESCAVVAARAAAVRALVEQGIFVLPSRASTATFIGLSGRAYQQAAETAPERAHIQRADYHDRASAILTLDDGRVLRVELVGTQRHEAESDETVGIVYLAIDDPDLAQLSPDDLRSRLTLMTDALCWRSHWHDSLLAAQASAAARSLAIDHLDAWGEDDNVDLQDIPQEHQRESRLHLEVKRILAESAEVRVPGLHASENLEVLGFEILTRGWYWPARDFRIADVQLERRFGRIVPDVVCSAVDTVDSAEYSPFFVEVTITNTIDDDRLDRIRSHGVPALEIDLSRFAGQITRDQLRDLVVDQVSGKRWLLHPTESRERAELRAMLFQLHEQRLADQATELQDLQLLEARRAAARATPPEVLAEAYLLTAEVWLTVQAQHDFSRAEGRAMPEWEQLRDAGENLTFLGYEDALDDDLIRHHGILAKLLSIRADHGIGYDYATGAEVLNAARTSRAYGEWPLYLLAERVYEPRMSARQWNAHQVWRQEVVDAIKQGDRRFMTELPHSALLSLLFPELAPGIQQLRARRLRSSAQEHPATPHLRRASAQSSSNLLQENRPGAGRPNAPAPAARNRGLNLSPDELKEWAARHPDQVGNWPHLFPPNSERGNKPG